MLPLYFYHHFRLDYPHNIIKIHRRRAKESSLHLVCKHQRTIMLTTIFCIHLLQLTIYFLLVFFSVLLLLPNIIVGVNQYSIYTWLLSTIVSTIYFNNNIFNLFCIICCSILFLFYFFGLHTIFTWNSVNSCCYY